jgi:acyl-CoA synthetase (AMP-forming)/AMP-acid ligase II
MNPAQPAKVNPKRFVDSIIANKVSYSFASPALWEVVSDYCLLYKIQLSSIKIILMAGAPVSGALIKKTAAIIPQDAVIHIPYGATEALPIVSITGKEVLKETWDKSRLGLGTCVGYALDGVDIRIIAISDDEITDFQEVRLLPIGQIGEIIVKGRVVTSGYENDAIHTRLAKITDGESFWHRMGDLGYLDDKNRLWFCGRQAHRVVTPEEVLYTIPCEAIINEHPQVRRSALVGLTLLDNPQYQMPVMIVEPFNKNQVDKNKLLHEVRTLAETSLLTHNIGYFLIHNDFPVDIRHNAKIFREQLAEWALTKL